MLTFGWTDYDACAVAYTVFSFSFHFSDPGDNHAFSDVLFDNQGFADAMYSSMNEEGVFIAQTGVASDLDDPSTMNSRDKFSFLFMNHLKHAGYKSLKNYEDAHGGFLGVWGFFAAFASSTNKLRWYANEAEVNLAIKKRMRSTTDNKSPLVYFDGATMQGYQYPSRTEEVVYCRTKPDAFGCDLGHGIDPLINDVSASDLEVKASTVEKSGLGVFTKVDIPEKSYMAVKEQTKDIYFPPSTYELIQDFAKHPAGFKHVFFESLFAEYGFGYNYFVSSPFGRAQVLQDYFDGFLMFFSFLFYSS